MRGLAPGNSPEQGDTRVRAEPICWPYSLHHLPSSLDAASVFPWMLLGLETSFLPFGLFTWWHSYFSGLVQISFVRYPLTFLGGFDFTSLLSLPPTSLTISYHYPSAIFPSFLLLKALARDFPVAPQPCMSARMSAILHCTGLSFVLGGPQSTSFQGHSRSSFPCSPVPSSSFTFCSVGFLLLVYFLKKGLFYVWSE